MSEVNAIAVVPDCGGDQQYRWISCSLGRERERRFWNGFGTVREQWIH